MEKYKKAYLDTYYPGWGDQDFIPCELSGKQAVDIHHILPRGKYPEYVNHPGNLMAMTRKLHDEKGQNKKYLQELVECHVAFVRLKAIEHGFSEEEMLEPLRTSGLLQDMGAVS